ncbi:MAG: hypothetical protein K1Y36_08180 [Blastocatellia bacterium]|nr:hypothetical protein [Blastocatellia bacterium]
MKSTLQKLGMTALLGGVFMMGFIFFTSTPASAQIFNDTRYGRPTEDWVRQQGRQTGYDMGLKHGVKDGVQGLRSNYRTQAYEYGLVGFQPAWVHDDNYKKGFRDAYRDGYQNGYANYYSYAREWGYYRDDSCNNGNAYGRNGRYDDRYDRNGRYDDRYDRNGRNDDRYNRNGRYDDRYGRNTNNGNNQNGPWRRRY